MATRDIKTELTSPSIASFRLKEVAWNPGKGIIAALLTAVTQYGDDAKDVTVFVRAADATEDPGKITGITPASRSTFEMQTIRAAKADAYTALLAAIGAGDDDAVLVELAAAGCLPELL